MKRILIAILWVVCGTFNYGATLGSFTHEFPYMSNLAPAVAVAAGGPFATPAVAFFIAGKDPHFLWKPYTTEQRKAIFMSDPERAHYLGEEYFEQHYN